MARSSIVVLALLASVAGQSDAAAQAAAPSETATSNRTEGVETTINPSGFALTTHGTWTPLARAAPAIGDFAPAVRASAKLSQRGRPAPVAHSSRRAIYLPHVFAAEAEYRLPTGLLDALIWTESRYNPFAISGAGAAGLGQLMPKTAKDLGVSNRFNPRESVWASARYLRKLLDKFGLVELAVAAYNAGPGAVGRAKGIPLNGETPGYVRSVFEAWENR